MTLLQINLDIINLDIVFCHEKQIDHGFYFKIKNYIYILVTL